MNAHVLRLIFCGFIFTGILPFTAFCDNQTKEFPEYHCRLTLPNEAWNWDESLDIPNLFAISESPEGYLFLFGAIVYNGNFPVNDKFIVGLEKGRLAQPEVIKKGGRKLTYCGVPCYEFETFMGETNMNSIARYINGHGYSFCLELLYPKGQEIEASLVENIFEGFVFIKSPTYTSSTESSAHKEGQYIGRIVGHLFLWSILLYAAYAIIKKIFLKK